MKNAYETAHLVLTTMSKMTDESWATLNGLPKDDTVKRSYEQGRIDAFSDLRSDINSWLNVNSTAVYSPLEGV